MDRGLWQIGVLGSKCLDRRSSRHAWIEDRESGLALVADRHSSRRAWIRDRESGSTLVEDRHAWIGVLGSAFFSPCLDRRQREWIGACGGSACLDWCYSRRAWIGVLLGAVLLAWIEISESLE